MGIGPLLKRFFAAPPNVKLVAAAVVCALAIGVAASFTATRDTRVALFATPLAPDQVAEVQTRLAAWNIAFAALPDNVRVAAGKRNDILLRLSIAGIPRPHLATSAELFAHAGALTPQAVLEAQTRDGLAADLATGLRGLDGVADARVIIAPAQSGMYADETSHEASASVRISLAPGARLAPRTIAGIRAFVAGGVPGLEPSHVTVLDDRGLAPEAAPSGDGDGGGDDGVQTALQSALDTAFGIGTTIVRVHRETLDERRDVHEVRRTPAGGIVSRSGSDERFTSAAKHYTKSSSVEDRGSDTRDETRVALPGATERRSVAVFVDAQKRLDLATIRSFAEAGAGIDVNRGDVLRVEAVRFASTAPVRNVPGGRWWSIAGAFAGVAPQLIVACSLAAAGFFGARPAYALAVKALETVTLRTTAQEVAGIPPVRVRGALAGEPPHIAAAIISALPAATATAVLELYPPDERAAIVRRLARAASPLVPDAEELLRARG